MKSFRALLFHTPPRSQKEAHGMVGLSNVTPRGGGGVNFCDVISVQRYSLNAFVSLFKMSVFLP